MSDNKIKIAIEVPENTFKKLEAQLESFEQKTGTEKGTIKSVEDLIVWYLENLTSAEEQFSKMADKLDEVFKTLDQKGINFGDIISGFSNKETKTEKPTAEKPVQTKKS